MNRVRDGDQVLMDIGQELIFNKVPVRLTREEEAVSSLRAHLFHLDLFSLFAFL